MTTGPPTAEQPSAGGAPVARASAGVASGGVASGGGASGSPLVGMVTAFDEAVGLGVVAAADGRSWGFHCTAVADGTRRIPVGARVTFSVVAARRGRFEAAGLRPAPD